MQVKLQSNSYNSDTLNLNSSYFSCLIFVITFLLLHPFYLDFIFSFKFCEIPAKTENIIFSFLELNNKPIPRLFYLLIVIFDIDNLFLKNGDWAVYIAIGNASPLYTKNTNTFTILLSFGKYGRTILKIF